MVWGLLVSASPKHKASPAIPHSFTKFIILAVREACKGWAITDKFKRGPWTHFRMGFQSFTVVLPRTVAGNTCQSPSASSRRTGYAGMISKERDMTPRGARGCPSTFLPRYLYSKLLNSLVGAAGFEPAT